MTSPRILFVDHTGVLGGGELSLLDIAHHFRDTARVVLFEDGPFCRALEARGVTVTVLPAPRSLLGVSRGGGWLADLVAAGGAVQMARKLAREAQPADVIYANSQKSMIVAVLAGWLSGTPVIWHLRDLLTSDHFSTLHRLAAVTAANLGVSRVIANSRATRDAFVAAGGRADRCTVVHNAISTEAFVPQTSGERSRLRRELGLGDGPIVGAFSRLAPWKGQHVLIDALPDLPGVEAVLVGEALFEEDREYGAALRNRAVAMGVEDRVRFLGFRSDVPQLMQAVDVVVHTSVAPEPFGRVVVEGMLAERPLVATDAGGVVEILDSGRTGLVVPPDDPNALAAALRHLLDHPDEARARASAGRQEALRRFSLDRLLSEITPLVSETAK
jgi:glycosyltransferase involved in cell wall biosynthesis